MKLLFVILELVRNIFNDFIVGFKEVTINWNESKFWDIFEDETGIGLRNIMDYVHREIINQCKQYCIDCKAELIREFAKNNSLFIYFYE